MNHPLPESLKKAIEQDARSVRPLAPAWKRAIGVTIVAAVVVIGSLVLIGPRLDISEIPAWLSWGSCIVQLGIGMILVGLALRESVPGTALPISHAVSAVGIAVIFQLLVGVLTWLYTPGMAINPWALGPGMACLRNDSMLALPTFITTLVLVFTALPLRAPMAGLLGGAGAAIAADAVNHLLCPASDMRHIVMWHTGAVVLFMFAGYVIGLVWQRLRWRSN
ncbi:MAG: DUF1109 domain-containing protein [bacterium]|nr:DUF1109 domain-containing protein [bacterium]